MKKLFSLVAVSFLFVLVLAGCGGEPAPEADDVSPVGALDASPAPEYDDSIDFDSVIVEGYDERPALGWGKMMFYTYFEDQYSDIDGLYVFSDLGFSVDFKDDYVATISVAEDSGVSFAGGIAVGSDRDSVVSAWGEPSKEADNFLAYFIDSGGELCGGAEAEAGIVFSLKDGVVSFMYISNDL